MAVLSRALRSTEARFLIAGGLATAINWLARVALGATLPFVASVVAAYGVGMVAGFLLYRAFVFTGSARRPHQQIGHFVAVNLVSLAVVTLSAETLLSALATLSVPPSVAEGVAHAVALAIGAVLNFTGHKRLTFRAAPQSA